MFLFILRVLLVLLNNIFFYMYEFSKYNYYVSSNETIIKNFMLYTYSLSYERGSKKVMKILLLYLKSTLNFLVMTLTSSVMLLKTRAFR